MNNLLTKLIFRKIHSAYNGEENEHPLLFYFGQKLKGE